MRRVEIGILLVGLHGTGTIHRPRGGFPAFSRFSARAGSGTIHGRLSLTRFQSKSSVPDAIAPGGATGRRVHVVTFGCQMNKYDSLLAEGRFRRAGWEVSGTLEDADAVVFNTCSVRDHAEERAWSWIGELKRAKARRPDLVIGVMGCMAQRVGAEIFARAGHVDVVAGTRQYHNLPELVERVRAARAASHRPMQDRPTPSRT